MAINMPRRNDPGPKEDQRIEIRFMVKQGLSQKQIREQLVQVHGQAALSQPSVNRWVRHIQNEGDNIRDKPRTGRPNKRTAKIPQINRILQADRRTTIAELSRQTSLSVGTVHRTSSKDLKLKKKAPKWIPHLLNGPQKARRVDRCRTALALFRRRIHPVERVVAEDESWCFAWDPENKQANLQWLGPNAVRPSIVRIERSTQKVMLVIFMDREGMIYREFVPNGCGIDRHLYQDMINCFREALRRKRRDLWDDPRSWALLHDGAPAHIARSVQFHLRYHRIQQVPHPGYSPDLNPCDYWFFSRMKKEIKGRRFHTVADLCAAVDQAINSISPAEFAAAFD